MVSEKQSDSEQGLPSASTPRESKGVSRATKRRAVASIFAIYAVWCAYDFVISAHDLWTADSSVTRHVGCHDASQRYLDRLVGSSGDIKAYKSHGHGKHDDKHHRHKDHGHDHGHPKWISPKEAEEIFLSVPSNDSIREKYTASPHPAGSGFDYITALHVKSEWERSLGLALSGSDENIYEAGSPESQGRVYDGMDKMGVWIDTYYPVMNTPVSSSVTLLSDPPVKAKLREDIVKGDPDSVYRDEVPVFHGLSVSGDVTGQVVYVGYGRKRDFGALQERGVDLTGKIALVKYGGNFRGLKIKAAQEAGAVGCLIFTDPGNDGEMTEEHGFAQYPDGPARQASSVQRGSVQFISVYPGDPSTPGEPAYKNATRSEGTNQPTIPSLPISYEDAIPILKALEGHGTPAGEISEDWIGGLGFYGVEYFTGPSELELHFVNEVNTRVMPIWNTMAVIPGHITDEVVVIGNHRDAWVLGAGDPNSGTAAHNEMVRGFGKLLSKGWKPLRTIVLASWDAEEYGLIGSTEWTEDFGDWLKVNNAVYLNVDVAVAGPNFKCEASPSLAWLIRRAAEQIQAHPDGTSVWDTRVAANDDWKTWRVQDGDLESLVEDRSETGVKALGSGSDYTAFLQRYGVASGDIGYTFGPKSPVYHYHSIYDSFTWQEKYGDPGFHRHVDAAKILGLLSLRAADSLVLPLNTTQYAIELQYYLEKVEQISQSGHLNGTLDLSPLSHSINHLINASITLDIKTSANLEKLHKLLPTTPENKRLSVKKQLKVYFWKVCSALGSSKCERKLQKHANKPAKLPKKTIAEIKKVLQALRVGNKKRQAFEGGFISEEGIKEREWYKHKGTAPGLWLGYGATTFPALTEALTIDKSVELAQKEADELKEMIDAMAKRLLA